MKEALYALAACEKTLAKLKISVEEIQRLSETEPTRLYHWDALLMHRKNMTGLLINAAKNYTPTRPLGHRIKNDHDGNPLFLYMLHARNAAHHPEDHGDKHPNDYSQSQLNFDDLIVINGPTKVTIRDTNVNGLLVNGIFNFSHSNLRANWEGSAKFSYRPSQIQMSPVKDQNGKVFEFPFSNVPTGILPEVYAATESLEWVNKWIGEFRGNLR